VLKLEPQCRLEDLRENGIATNYKQVKELGERYGFPPGKLLSANIRAWSVEAVNDWLKTRPTGPSALILSRAAKATEGRRAQLAKAKAAEGATTDHGEVA
jgi:hypothetical protein